MVDVVCTNCQNRHRIYDLALYPAASSFRDPHGQRKYLNALGEEIFTLIIVFSYSDETPFHSPSFNPNDITWFSLLTLDEDMKVATEIISDETA
jgi:hypothetical protein